MKALRSVMMVAGVMGAIALPVGANLVTNGSFEGPVVPVGGAIANIAPTGWILTEDFYYCRLINWGIAQDGVQNFQTQRKSLWQNTGIPMVEGVQYTLSFWTRQEVANEGVNNIRELLFAAPDATSIGWYPILTYVETSQATADTWEQWSCSYTCNAANAGKYLLVMVDGTARLGHYTYIDNVVLTPEPATLILLSLGGLILRRKNV